MENKETMRFSVMFNPVLDDSYKWQVVTVHKKMKASLFWLTSPPGLGLVYSLLE